MQIAILMGMAIVHPNVRTRLPSQGYRRTTTIVCSKTDSIHLIPQRNTAILLLLRHHFAGIIIIIVSLMVLFHRVLLLILVLFLVLTFVVSTVPRRSITNLWVYLHNGIIVFIIRMLIFDSFITTAIPVPCTATAVVRSQQFIPRIVIMQATIITPVEIRSTTAIRLRSTRPTVATIR